MPSQAPACVLQGKHPNRNRTGCAWVFAKTQANSGDTR